jgi:hypothetical protein
MIKGKTMLELGAIGVFSALAVVNLAFLHTSDKPWSGVFVAALCLGMALVFGIYQSDDGSML